MISPDCIKEELLDRLNAAENAGSFAHYEVVNDPPNTGLFIHGFGMTNLPFSEHDVEKVIAASSS